MPRKKNKCEDAGVGDGTVVNLTMNILSGRKSISERYVQNTAQARNGHRTQPCGNDVETERRNNGRLPP